MGVRGILLQDLRGEGSSTGGGCLRENGTRIRQVHLGGSWARAGGGWRVAGGGKALPCIRLSLTLPAAEGCFTLGLAGEGHAPGLASGWLPCGGVPWELRPRNPRKS